MRGGRRSADLETVIGRLVTTLAAAVLLSGCSSEQGLRAQELLQQAEAAQQALRSSTFEGEMSFTFGNEAVAMEFGGATSPDGEWFSMRSSGIPGGGDFSMQVLKRGERAWTNADGRWRATPAPNGFAPSGTMSSAAFQQLARYVKAVRVNEHQVVSGKPVTIIGGDIDTQGMIEALTKLGPVAGGIEGLDFSELGIEFGDIHAVLTIEERTHLLAGAFVTFSVDVEGRHLDAEIRYRLTSANEPVELPTP